MKESDAKESTRDFAIKSVLINHCGRLLSPDEVDKIAEELKVEIEQGPCSWTFKL